MPRIYAFLGGAFFALASAATVPSAPDKFTVASYLQHFTFYYCPFSVSGAVAHDLSQLVITYDLSKPGKPFPGPGHETDCLLRIQYDFTPGDNQYRFTGIEHELSGAQNVDVQVSTKTVFDRAFGPVTWTPITLSSSSRTAKNSTNNMLSQSSTGNVNIKTTFKTSASASLKDVQLAGKLTQTFKMEWAGPGQDDRYFTCDQPDNQGNADNGLCIYCRYWGDDPHPGCKRDT